MLKNFFRVGSERLNSTILRYKKGVFNQPNKSSKEYLVKTHKETLNKNSRQYVNEIKKMLETKTPKVSTLLVLGTTIPTLYYLYDILTHEYEDPIFYQSIKKGIDWANYINIFTAGVYFGLETIKYSDRRATLKTTSGRKTHIYNLIVLGLSLASFSFWDTSSKYIVAPTVLCDVTLLFAETKLASDGVIPYYLFDMKYRLHIFSVVNLAFFYYSLKHLDEDMKASPHKYKLEKLEKA